MSERLELVTDFASLRASDYVVLKACPWCGAEHRGLLLSLAGDIRRNAPSGGVHRSGPAWLTTIAAHDGRTGCVVVSPRAVDERYVYRINIPPAEEARETARPKERERIR